MIYNPNKFDRSHDAVEYFDLTGGTRLRTSILYKIYQIASKNWLVSKSVLDEIVQIHGFQDLQQIRI